MSYSGEFETFFNILSPLEEPVFINSQIGYKLIEQGQVSQIDNDSNDFEIGLPSETGKRYKLWIHWVGQKVSDTTAHPNSGMALRLFDENNVLLDGGIYQYQRSTSGGLSPLAAQANVTNGTYWPVCEFNSDDIANGQIMHIYADIDLNLMASTNATVAQIPNSFNLFNGVSCRARMISALPGISIYNTGLVGFAYDAALTSIPQIRLYMTDIAAANNQVMEYALFAIDTGKQALEAPFM